MNKFAKYVWSKWKGMSTTVRLMVVGVPLTFLAMISGSWPLLLMGTICILSAAARNCGLFTYLKELKKDYDAFEE